MTRRRRVDVNLDELDQIIDRGRLAPLSEWEGEKLKTALHAMAERRLQKPQPVMGAIEPLCWVAQKRLPSRTPRSIPATSVRNAVQEKCTVRRRRQRWCGS